jgi:hypothetical protein
MWFKRNSVFYGVVLTVALGLAVGCSVDDSATGVSDPVAGQSAQLSAGKDQDQDLKHFLDAERHRIHELEKDNREVRDSLRRVWNAFKRANKHLRRNNSPFPICEPEDYAADSKIIGPEGGTLNIGHHRLVIPKGALTEPTVITGEAPVSLLIEVQLSPHGLQFEKPAELELDYGHCFLPADYEYRVAYINNGDHILEWPVSVDKGGEVEAWIWHFSKYAVAW